MALFMIFYKGKHTQLGGQLTDIPNYIYRWLVETPFHHFFLFYLEPFLKGLTEVLTLILYEYPQFWLDFGVVDRKFVVYIPLCQLCHPRLIPRTWRMTTYAWTCTSCLSTWRRSQRLRATPWSPSSPPSGVPSGCGSDSQSAWSSR